MVTPFFPTSKEKYRGHSAYQTLKQLEQWAEVEVFCPLSTYPNWLRPRNFLYSRPSLDYRPPRLNTHYFEYPALPVISRAVNSLVCAHYLEPRLRASRPDLVLNFWLYPEGHAAVRVAHNLGIPAVVRHRHGSQWHSGPGHSLADSPHPAGGGFCSDRQPTIGRAGNQSRCSEV